jgi:6-phospho-beta-glucosidase
MGVKVAVIGAGSTYTPELVEGFVARDDRLRVDQLALLDTDAERLDIVGGLAARMMTKAGWAGELELTGDRDRAIEGADFVICQLRIGGQAARFVDETLPLRFGCIGQETTGPGGFAKALRTIPVVLELAEETARRGASDAWFVDFTNPVGIVTQALLDEGHRALGLCNVAIDIQRRIAQEFRVDPPRVRLEHVGLNHLSWERAVFVDDEDVLPAMLDDRADAIAELVEMPADLLRLLRTIPSSYLRYYYMTARVLEEQRTQPSRAEEVMAIERGLLDLYKDPSLDSKPELLEKRGGAFYSEAAAQLVTSLATGDGDVQVVDVRNGGAMPDLPDDAVVEIPARIELDGAHPAPLAPLAPEMLGLVEAAKAYERLAATAAMTGSREAALKALLANPLVDGYETAAALLDPLLEANRQHLPRFFPD